MSPYRDADRQFHRVWLGLAQPYEGLVFSIPVLAEAQIAPEVRPSITTELEAHLVPVAGGLALHDVRRFFERFLGYDQPGRLVGRDALPEALRFYAPEGRQAIRPSFAIARGPFEKASASPLDLLNELVGAPEPETTSAEGSPYFALVWDLGDDAPDPTALDLDAPEDETGSWRYPPTAKFERLLRQANVPVGFVSNRRALRLVYAPAGEATSHLTFRFDELARREGRPVLAALDLLAHARRTYHAAPEHTLEGLLAESRRRQADVTSDLAEQVFQAVERLVEGFEHADARRGEGAPDWLRAALSEEGDHFVHGVLSVVLRLVFLLYAEDQGMLPVDHPFYAQHLSVLGLYERLAADAGQHPESMQNRFGAYAALITLFRAIFLGVDHGYEDGTPPLTLPPRSGRLFDPNSYPFLEDEMPDWTAAVNDSAARAEVHLPAVDDGCIYDVLHRLVVFEGQRLSYRTLDVEQLGAVYESLMGFHVLRAEGPAVRVGKRPGVWLEVEALSAMSAVARKRHLKQHCGLSNAQVKKVERARADGDEALMETLLELAPGRKDERPRHRASIGRLLLQPGDERRRTGSHYTPRALTEPIVARTLEPLLACLGPEPTEEQLLSLKIGDPAMGSGAFLVAACRALARELVAAWTRTGEVEAIAERVGDPELHARRLVAQRCLYGVDKNPAAVELAKLSLWLVTFNPDLPFTFVDHALRHGDALVGLGLEQVRSFHWDVGKGQTVPTCREALRDALEQALEHREEILALATHEDVASHRERARLLSYAEQATGAIRAIADACVGAFFAHAKKKDRDKERDERLQVVERYLGAEAGSEERLSLRGQIDAWAEAIRAEHAPFHWMLELPEVFYLERPDPLADGAANGAAFMEAFVGNPPFMGGSSVSSEFGAPYRDWLLTVHKPAHGNADLSAHFFRRTASLLGGHGALGLIATNTIAQGDTRATGLQALLRRGFAIHDATRTMPWPGQAAVTVSVVHAAIGAPGAHATPRLDGGEVESINSRLRGKPERSDAVPLGANAAMSFLGSKVYGQGFTLTPEQRDDLIAKDPRNGARIFPYLGGKEVNSSPTQSHDRYVISFMQMPLDEAERWPDLITIVRELVKPERDRLRTDTGPGAHGKKYWWQFQHPRKPLYEAIAPLDRCLVTARVTKHLCFSFQPSDRVLNEKLYVFPLEAFTAFAVLQSRVHVPWAWLLSSTMKTDLNYSASNCFETFPFPEPDPRAVIPALEEAGRALYEARAAFMVDTSQGLTSTYNLLRDPSCDDERIHELRTLHEAMDRAVLDAYGWTDVEVPPFTPATEAEAKAVEAFEDEVIDRLYVLNAERAAEEQRLGKGRGKKKGRGAKPRRGKPAPADDTQGNLFE